MMNATPINQLPAPMSTSISSEKAAPAGTSYQDLIKNLDINKMTQQSQNSPMQQPQMQSQQPQLMPKQTQMMAQQPQVMPQQTQMMPKQTQMMAQQPQVMPQQTQMMPQQTQMVPQQMKMMPQMLQTPVNPSAQQNVMQQLQAQASVYDGGMPQSAPISEYLPQDFTIQQGPLKSDLLPDPMFFQNPPPPPKVKKIYVDKTPPKTTFMGFDTAKIKNAILVGAIVFALISYVAPLLAKNLPWTVNADTGKFTAYGLLTISAMTGGLYLGVTALIDKFGNGMN